MSQSTIRRKFTREFKVEAVRLSNQVGLSVVQAARDLGIRSKLLSRWRSEFAETPSEAFRDHGKRLARDEDLERLRRENEQLRMERDILKKATAFFANPSR